MHVDRLHIATMIFALVRPSIRIVVHRKIITGQALPPTSGELLSKCNINLISIKYSRRYAFTGYNLPSNYQFVYGASVPSITFPAARWRFNSYSGKYSAHPAVRIFIDVAVVVVQSALFKKIPFSTKEETCPDVARKASESIASE